jgi:hypothetical protein
MSDKPEKKPDAAAAPPAASGKEAPAKKGGFLTKTPVLLGGVMVIEAVLLFAGFKIFGGGAPKAAAGAEIASAEHGEGHGGGGEGEHGDGKAGAPDTKKFVELQVVDFKAPNKVSGRTFLFDVTVFAVTKGDHGEKVKTALKDREALIKDRIRTIIAQSDPEKLMGSAEPGLETLRRQVKYQLDAIIGEGLIEEVLVPKCIPFRTDY